MENIEKKIVQLLKVPTRLSEKDIAAALEIPPDPKLGDIAFPCFILAKRMKKKPDMIAREIKEKMKLPKGSIIRKVSATGPYLNFFFDDMRFAKLVLEEIWKKKREYGSSRKYRDKQAIVDMIGLNPNKAGHVGHIRNGCISDTLVRCMQKLGYRTVKQSFINDMGVPTSMVFWAYKNMKTKLPKKEGLLKKEDHWQGRIYEMMQQLVKDKPSVKKAVEDLHLVLESGKDKKLVKEQREFADRCIAAQSETWARLRCSLDLDIHESDIVRSGLFKAALRKLKKAKAVYTAEHGPEKGAVVMKLSHIDYFKGMKNPDKILARKDGRVTYTGKDVAMQAWKVNKVPDLFKYKPVSKISTHTEWGTNNLVGRKKNLGFNKNTKCIYVIGAEQTYVIAVDRYSLKLMGYEKEFEDVYHLAYGLVGFGGKAKISSREGAVGLTADEILDKAAEMALKEIKERKKVKGEKKQLELAEAIGSSAVRYYLIKTDPIKFVQFTFEDALNFEGNTGPYLQYSLVRAKRIQEKVKVKPNIKVDFSLLKQPEEIALVRGLAEFSGVVNRVVNEYAIHLLGDYTFRLTSLFNSFYEKCSVIRAGNEDLKKARMLLVWAFAQVLSNCLYLMGIEEVDSM